MDVVPQQPATPAAANMTLEELTARTNEILRQAGGRPASATTTAATPAAEAPEPQIDFQKLLDNILGSYKPGTAKTGNGMELDLVHEPIPESTIPRPQAGATLNRENQNLTEDQKRDAEAVQEERDMLWNEISLRDNEEKRLQREKLQTDLNEVFPYLVQALEKQRGVRLSDEQVKKYQKVISNIPWLPKELNEVLTGLVAGQACMKRDVQERLNNSATTLESIYTDASKYRKLYHETKKENEIQAELFKSKFQALEDQIKQMQTMQEQQNENFGRRAEQRFDSMNVSATAAAGKTYRESELIDNRPSKKQLVVASRNTSSSSGASSFDVANAGTWAKAAYVASCRANTNAKSERFHVEVAKTFDYIEKLVGNSSYRGEKYKQAPYYKSFKQAYEAEKNEVNTARNMAR
jgi:hypothetical protein